MTLSGAPVPAGDRHHRRREPGADGVDRLTASLVLVWQEVLGQDCHADSDLFDLGADSLTLLRVAARVREVTGRHATLGLVMDAPTPRELTAALAGGPTRDEADR